MKDFSAIQHHILFRLKNAKNLRYSELHPKDKTPNDLFNYHLQFLVKKGYVIKDRGRYSLGEIGIQYVADLTLMSNEKKVISLFKYNVITIVSRLHKGKIQILNQIRQSNPSFGKIGVMGGAILKGEPILTAANRKLQIETGLQANFNIVGMERRFMYVKNELFSDILFPIAYSDKPMGEIIDTEYGINKWMDIDESIKYQTSNKFDCIDSITTVLKAIKAKKIKKLPFFYVESIKIGNERP
jgi:hypothetical protein